MRSRSISVSELQQSYNGKELANLQEILEIKAKGNPLPIAVVLPYGEFLRIQKQIIDAYEGIERYMRTDEGKELTAVAKSLEKYCTETKQ